VAFNDVAEIQFANDVPFNLCNNQRAKLRTFQPLAGECVVLLDDAPRLPLAIAESSPFWGTAQD